MLIKEIGVSIGNEKYGKIDSVIRRVNNSKIENVKISPLFDNLW
jgi:hypothetical protein